MSIEHFNLAYGGVFEEGYTLRKTIEVVAKTPNHKHASTRHYRIELRERHQAPNGPEFIARFLVKESFALVPLLPAGAKAQSHDVWVVATISWVEQHSLENAEKQALNRLSQEASSSNPP